MTKRKLFPIVLILLFAIVWPALMTGQTAGRGATVVPDHITLTWTGNPATTMTVTWRTDTTITNGLVEYKKCATSPRAPQYAKASSSDFTTDLQSTSIFMATLTGLSPNTKYSYRVGDGKHWSSTHTFTTADPKAHKFKFLVFGDSQSVAGGESPYKLWHDTVQNAYKANPDAKFMVNVGDLVDTGQSGAHWNSWFAAAAGVIDTIPEMPVVGNHETCGLESTRRPIYWNAQFHLPQNGPTGLKNQVYSYDYGQVHFAVLDSQQDEEHQYGNIFKPQQKWLASDLASTKATWKIVFFHKAPYELHAIRISPAVKSAFCPVIDSRHVDIVFNGHDHGIGHTYPINNGVSRDKPSQGTIYYIAGRSGSKSYSDLIKKSWNTFFYNPQDQPNYLVVEVADTKLTIKAVKQDGTLIDTFFVDKGKDIDSDKRN